MGLSKQRKIISSLFPANQSDLHLEFLQDILDALPALSKTSDPYFLSSYTSGLLQPICRAESIQAMSKSLSAPEQLNSTSLRFLKEAHQADQECLILYEANSHVKN
jgi:hypothetical protein